MPSTPSNGKTVLITGINGYIASVIGYHMLKKGYNVRGTIRAKECAAPLMALAYKEYATRVRIFEVLDMADPGAFDEAVKGTLGYCSGRWDI